ncbi:MAG: hypothetical protein R3B45_08005 [Bdellovibrionota bacterium]
MSIFASVLLAINSSLIVNGLSEPQRKEILKPYFQPQFGEVLDIDLTSLTKKNKKNNPEHLKGYIKVSPPAGTCFTITRNINIPDIRICKTQIVRFQLQDLDLTGRLTWKIDTGESDIGTYVSWPTVISIGKVVDLNMEWPGLAKTVFINKCLAQHTPSEGRLIYLYFVTGERWKIRLPDTDTAIEQLDEVPNVFQTHKIVEKQGVNEKKSGQSKRIRAQLVYESDKEKYQKRQWVPTWQTHPRDAYSMSADGFFPNGSTTPGLRGKCRYRYDEYRTDAQSGSLECHDVNSFKWVYVPVPCITDLKFGNK